MAVCFYLTHTDAVLLRDMCYLPRLRAILQRQIDAPELTTSNKRTVLLAHLNSVETTS